MMARLIVFLAGALLICGAAEAGHHKHVAGNALEAGECYILEAPITIASGFPRRHALRNVSVPQGNIICIDKRDGMPGDLWYAGRIMRMQTFDRSRHMPVWIDSRDLMEHGVTLAY